MQLAGALANRGTWHDGACPIDRTLRAVGNRTSILLMREACYGTTRFDDFAQRVGITDAVTAARLKQLVKLGLLERRPYQEPGQRTRFEYVLTEAGDDFLPVLLAVKQWGDRHLRGAAGPPLALRHAGCDQPVSVHVLCDAGHVVPVGEIQVRRARRPPTPDAYLSRDED